MPILPFLLRSMRARMTVLFALCTMIVTVLGDAAVIRHEYRNAEDRIHETLSVAAERARREAEEPEHLHKSLLEVVKDDQAEIAAGGLDMFVLDEAGKLLWRSRKIPFPLSQREWRTQGMWYKDQRLILASSWVPVQKEMEERALALVGLGAFLVLSAAFGVWFVVGKTLSPIDALTAQAQRASVKELSVHLESPSPDLEMVRLASTLNNLLERLERETQLRGRFYLAASHELRTPLQALLGSLDVALSRPRDARGYEQALQEAQHQTERLTQLVQDLLQLNALEMRANLPQAARVNIADRIERIIITLSNLISERRIQLDTMLPDVEVEVPPSHLDMLLRNVIENAIKYARPDSTVEIRLLMTHNQARLHIFNPCDVPTGDTTSWFEPFYRPDASRNSQTGGNGLGLAIANAIARLQNWELTLMPRQDGMMTTVIWPLPMRTMKPNGWQRSPAHSAAGEAHLSTPQ